MNKVKVEVDYVDLVSEGKQKLKDSEKKLRAPRSNPYSDALSLIKALKPVPPYIFEEVENWRRLLNPKRMIEPIYTYLNTKVTELGNLAQKGVVLPNRMAAIMILIGLSEEYDNMIRSIEHASLSLMTVKDVTMMIAEESKKLSQKRVGHQNKSNDDNKKCFRCGYYGHIAVNCQSKNKFNKQ